MVTTSEKQEVFLQDDLWQATINRGFEKGIPHVLLEMFTLPQYRQQLWDSFEDGSFRVDVPRVGYVPKDNGDLREVLINNPLNRIAFTQMTKVLFQLYGSRVSEACTSYQTGIGVATTVKQMLMKADGLQNGCKLDLSKYFDTVPIELINRELDCLDTGCGMDRVIREYYNMNLIRCGKVTEEHYKSLSQGCAIASF